MWPASLISSGGQTLNSLEGENCSGHPKKKKKKIGIAFLELLNWCRNSFTSYNSSFLANRGDNLLYQMRALIRGSRMF